MDYVEEEEVAVIPTELNEGEVETLATEYVQADILQSLVNSTGFYTIKDGTDIQMTIQQAIQRKSEKKISRKEWEAKISKGEITRNMSELLTKQEFAIRVIPIPPDVHPSHVKIAAALSAMKVPILAPDSLIKFPLPRDPPRGGQFPFFDGNLVLMKRVDLVLPSISKTTVNLSKEIPRHPIKLSVYPSNMQLMYSFRDMLLTLRTAKDKGIDLPFSNQYEQLLSLFTECNRIREDNIFGNDNFDSLMRRLQAVVDIKKANHLYWNKIYVNFADPHAARIKARDKIKALKESSKMYKRMGNTLKMEDIGDEIRKIQFQLTENEAKDVSPYADYVQKMQVVFPLPDLRMVPFTTPSTYRQYLLLLPGPVGDYMRSKHIDEFPWFSTEEAKPYLGSYLTVKKSASAGLLWNAINPEEGSSHDVNILNEFALSAQMMSDLQSVLQEAATTGSFKVLAEFYDAWDFLRLSAFHPKPEVYSHEKAQRIIYGANTVAFHPALLLLRLIHAKALRADPKTLLNNKSFREITSFNVVLTHFTPLLGGIQELMEGMKSVLLDSDFVPFGCFVPFVYSDNLYLFYKGKESKSGKMYIMYFSLDGNKMEGSHSRATVSSEFARVAQISFGLDQSAADPTHRINSQLSKGSKIRDYYGGTITQEKPLVAPGTEKKVKRKIAAAKLSADEALGWEAHSSEDNPNMTATWFHYITHFLPSLCVNTVALAGRTQFIVPGQASGIAPTYHLNTALMCLTVSDFYKWEPVDDLRAIIMRKVKKDADGYAVIDADDFFKHIPELYDNLKRDGISLKVTSIIGMVGAGLYEELAKPQVVPVDLLGFDVKGVMLDNSLRLCAVLQRSRMLKAMLFSKGQIRRSKSLQEAVKIDSDNVLDQLLSLTVYRTMYMVGGWLDPAISVLLEYLCITTSSSLKSLAKTDAIERFASKLLNDISSDDFEGDQDGLISHVPFMVLQDLLLQVGVPTIDMVVKLQTKRTENMVYPRYELDVFPAVDVTTNFMSFSSQLFGADLEVPLMHSRQGIFVKTEAPVGKQRTVLESGPSTITSTGNRFDKNTNEPDMPGQMPYHVEKILNWVYDQIKLEIDDDRKDMLELHWSPSPPFKVAELLGYERYNEREAFAKRGFDKIGQDEKISGFIFDIPLGKLSVAKRNSLAVKLAILYIFKNSHKPGIPFFNNFVSYNTDFASKLRDSIRLRFLGDLKTVPETATEEEKARIRLSNKEFNRLVELPGKLLQRMQIRADTYGELPSFVNGSVSTLLRPDE